MGMIHDTKQTETVAALERVLAAGSGGHSLNAHATGTVEGAAVRDGELRRWWVTPEGDATFELYRSARREGRALFLSLPATALERAVETLRGQVDEHMALPRHLDTAERVLAALADHNPNTAAFVAWLEQQRPHAEVQRRGELREQVEALQTDDDRALGEVIGLLAPRASEGLRQALAGLAGRLCGDSIERGSGRDHSIPG